MEFVIIFTAWHTALTVRYGLKTSPVPDAGRLDQSSAGAVASNAPL